MTQTNLTVNPGFESDEYFLQILYYTTLVNMCVVSQVVCVFGMAANIVNIRVFLKQGFQDGVIITLTALSVSDLGALMFNQLSLVCFNPLISEKDLQFSRSVISFVAAILHQFFIKSSGMITAFASFERCISVVLPLRVKTILKRRVTIYANISILLSPYAFYIPTFLSVYVDVRFMPGINTTILEVMYGNNRDILVIIQFSLSDMLVPICTFFVLLTCTSIIFKALTEQSNWRESAAKGKKSNLARKERATSKMLVAVSVMYMSLLLPQCIMFAFVALARNIYSGVSDVVIGILLLNCIIPLHVINSSVTIVIYYTMSSRYRSSFHELLESFKTKFKYKNTF
uniref:G-protein coupled receptors family 1 profile domain-containing protein n=1 Tax=Biomphalaria glabrata TaxID=6526 RepID=A0A2C9LD13_BIOGL